MNLSIVIPAFNEEAVIEETLTSIKMSLQDISHEVIVVDNGSTDRTSQIAESLGCQVLVVPGVLIGELRNIGAQKASGDILLFNDADVLLTPAWRQAFLRLKDEIQGQNLIVGGSLQVSDPENMLHKYWFQPLLNKKEGECNYVGTGNMLVSRRLFDQVGGFSRDLRTGEDYDFCLRARNSCRATVRYVSNLSAIHLGYPEDVGSFFRREQWHGKGDVQTLAALLKSKVAIFSSSIAMLVVFSVLSIALTKWWVAFLFVAIAAALVVFMSFYKARVVGGIEGRCYHIFLTFMYCIARATSKFR
ncbi:glycosyltransferase [Hahella sp. KA22]|uniref:glycosyltransferase n=1 Tax=Hahella sp. KA22 TaxID=1628392 RepID=UPI000FDEF592|nr:glycosyltransferase [Hahella sp. KA22]AZZ92989.1 glycosyltransferase [Hahella sp. KA22]QAY56363.1 glycosyltransferase [Hahella sp. KA22]